MDRYLWRVSALIAVVVLPLGAGSVMSASASASVSGGAGAVQGVRASSGSGDSSVSAALAAAEASGDPVEVASLRDEFSSTFANPDGTLQLDLSSAPVRGRTESGVLADVDLTLVRRSDGRVGPRSAAAQVSFSPGGPGASMVQVQADGGQMLVGWDGVLPEPLLDGESAVYPDVYAGVDLRLTATLDGYREVLVVKTPEAAASQALAQVSFPVVAGGGLRAQGGSAGRLTVLDRNGTAVFTSGPALMWDSAGEAASVGAAAAAAPSKARVMSEAAVAAVTGTATEDGGSVDPVAGPGEGDNVARLPTSVSATTLTIVPDRSLMTSPATVYPLYVDPQVGLDKDRWLLLSTTGENRWKWTNRDDGEGVGYCAANCGSGFVKRQFYSFPRGRLSGKQVLDVTFRAIETWAVSCTASAISLYKAKSGISAAMEWKGQPALVDLLSDRVVSAGRPGCADPGHTGVEFNDAKAASPAYTNLTSTIRAFANGTAGNRLTLALRAGNESDWRSWKRFREDVVLSVVYLPKPAAPTGVGVRPTSGTTALCSTTQAAAVTVGSTRPTVAAVVQTAVQPLRGESRGELRADFLVQRLDPKTKVWSNVVTGQAPPATVVPDGTAVSMATAALTDGRSYRVRARTLSLWSYKGKSGTLASGVTRWCYFGVDTTAPKAPSVTSDGTYRTCTADSCLETGGVGVGGVFTLAAAAGDKNITGFRWRLISQGTTGLTSAGTLTVIPKAYGAETLSVAAKDSLGRFGEETTFLFRVAAPASPVGVWSFATDGADSTTGTAHPMVLSAAGASLDARGRTAAARAGAATPGAVTAPDKALALDGSSGYAATASPVLDTSGAFTVSTWAFLSNGSKDAAVVSQQTADAVTPGFTLGYAAAEKTWRFTVKNAAGVTVTSTAVTPAVTGVWTHVAAVYDPNSGRATVYVDGRAGGAAAIPATARLAKVTGPLVLGRAATSATGFGQYFTGLVDAVRVWQRALPEQEIGTEQALLAPSSDQADTAGGFGGTALVADWDPTVVAPGSRSVPDTSPYARPPLELSGAGVVVSEDGLVLDGKGAATTTGPVVDEGASFTVSVEAAFDPAVMAALPVGARMQLLGQRDGPAGANSTWSVFYEQIEPGAGTWSFARTTPGDAATVVETVADSADPVVWSDIIAEQGETPELVSVQLTGVYDVQRDTVTVYVDAETGATAVGSFDAAAQGSGELSAGQARRAGAWTDHAAAVLTDVRIWAGAMQSAKQVADQVGQVGQAAIEETTTP